MNTQTFRDHVTHWNGGRITTDMVRYYASHHGLSPRHLALVWAGRTQPTHIDMGNSLLEQRIEQLEEANRNLVKFDNNQGLHDQISALRDANKSLCRSVNIEVEDNNALRQDNRALRVENKALREQLASLKQMKDYEESPHRYPPFPAKRGLCDITMTYGANNDTDTEIGQKEVGNTSPRIEG